MMPEPSPDPESALSDAPPELEFFEAMAWPVPLSFAGAIASMRFEQGDVLYRDRRAYEALDGEIPKGLSAIQVLLPQRSTRGASADVSSDRRLSSWQSEVTLELIDLGKGESEIRVLSQGKLAMALFSGDDAWLDSKRDDPPLPWSARDLHQRLEQSLAGFDLRKSTKKGSRFVFVVDLASDASRTKAMAVEDSLRASGKVERIDLSPTEAETLDAKRFHPSLVLRGLILPKRTSEDVLPILRHCLYGGSTSEVAEGETAPDRFSIGRHGVLQSFD